MLANTPLPSPEQIKQRYPLSSEQKDFVNNQRTLAKNIIEQKDNRYAVIVGPCSVHDTTSTLEYGLKHRELASTIDKNFYLVMRVYFEKPRTTLGWKGLLHDPMLDGSFAREKGIVLTRKLLLELTDLKISCATELLDPLIIGTVHQVATSVFFNLHLVNKKRRLAKILCHKFNINHAFRPYRPENTVRSFKYVRPSFQTVPGKDCRLHAGTAAIARLNKMSVKPELGHFPGGM